MPSPVKARILIVSGDAELRLEKSLFALGGPWLGKSLVIQIPYFDFWLMLKLKKYSHHGGYDCFDAAPLDIDLLSKQGLGLSRGDFTGFLLGRGWKKATS